MNTLNITPDEAVEAWVAALRSGNYKQGMSWLHQVVSDDREEYCCLGVFCSLFDDLDKEYDNDVCMYMYNGMNDFLPAEVSTILNIKDDGQFHVDNHIRDEILHYHDMRTDTTTLVELNDGEVPFSDIADVIEYCWKNDLFVKAITCTH